MRGLTTRARFVVVTVIRVLEGGRRLSRSGKGLLQILLQDQKALTVDRVVRKKAFWLASLGGPWGVQHVTSLLSKKIQEYTDSEKRRVFILGPRASLGLNSEPRLTAMLTAW